MHFVPENLSPQRFDEVTNRTLLDSLLVLSGQQKDTVEVHLTKIHQIF